MCGIYSIRNKKNNKQYIGRTNNFNIRWKKHTYYLRNNKHHNKHLQRAWDKYGEENFEFTILEECPYELSGEREHYWITHFKTHLNENGYNMSLGGEGEIPTDATREKRRLSMLGKNLGRKLTDEHKRKIGEASKGRKHTQDTINKLRELNSGPNNYFYGKKFSKEHREKLSKSRTGEKNHFYGKKHSDKSKALMSEAHKGHVPSNKGVFKLSDADIEDILHRISGGEMQITLAKEYNVGKSTIGRIVRMEGPYEYLKKSSSKNGVML